MESSAPHLVGFAPTRQVVCPGWNRRPLISWGAQGRSRLVTCVRDARGIGAVIVTLPCIQSVTRKTEDKMVKEFKEFISKGNVVDLAVAVIIGAAFGAIVKSFTEDVLNGVLGAVGGKPDFTQLTLSIGKGEIRYGSFLTAVINFFIIALALFVVVKVINRMQQLALRKAEEADTKETEIDLLTQIRDALVPANATTASGHEGPVGSERTSAERTVPRSHEP